MRAVPAELGDERHHRLAPGRPHVGLHRGERGIEPAEQLRQPAIDGALVVVGIPAVKREGANARTVGVGQKLRGRSGRLGEIGAHLVDVSDLDRRPHLARLAGGRRTWRQGRERDALFKHARERRVGVAIEVE